MEQNLLGDTDNVYGTTPKNTKETNVKTILFSLAYLTLIKLPVFMSTVVGGRGGGARERERD